MNILRLSLLSLTLAMAVVTLGYVTPLQAQNVCLSGAFCDRDGDGFFKKHKRCEVCGGETDCDDSDSGLTNDCSDTGGSKATYIVEMVIGNDRTGLDTMCTSITERALWAGFPINSCPIVLADDFFYPSDEYCICYVGVNNKPRGTDVKIVFSQAQACDKLGCGEAWHTQSLPAEIVVGGPGDFKVVLNDPTGIVLTKNHQPERGSTLDDTIFVGDIIFTEIP